VNAGVDAAVLVGERHVLVADVSFTGMMMMMMMLTIDVDHVACRCDWTLCRSVWIKRRLTVHAALASTVLVRQLVVIRYLSHQQAGRRPCRHDSYLREIMS